MHSLSGDRVSARNRAHATTRPRSRARNNSVRNRAQNNSVRNRAQNNSVRNVRQLDTAHKKSVRLGAIVSTTVCMSNAVSARATKSCWLLRKH